MLLLTRSTGFQKGFGLNQAQTTGTTGDQNNLVREIEFRQTLGRSEESRGFLSTFQVHVFFLGRLRRPTGLSSKSLLTVLTWMRSLETLITRVCRGAERTLVRQVGASSQATNLELAGEARRYVELPWRGWPTNGVGEAWCRASVSERCRHAVGFCVAGKDSVQMNAESLRRLR